MSQERLIRAIGRYDLTAATVNAVIGSSVFSMPALIAGHVGPLAPLAYLIAGLGVLSIALCFAEVASRFREAGGPYLYVREAFGPHAGFQAGWLTFWIRVTSMAANLNVFADYLAQSVAAAGSPGGRMFTMALVIAVITAINVIGVRQATWTVDLFTVAKLLPLFVLIGLGLFAVRSEVIASQAVSEHRWAQAILLLMFAYGGFEAPLIPAGETKDPRKDTAFALLAALFVIASVYMLVQIVVIGVVPNVASQKAPVAAAFERLLGPIGLTVASLAATVSIYGWATGSVLQSPRVLYSMAEQGQLPRALASVHPRFRTPHVAILAYSGLALALAFYGSFEWNATLSAIVRLVTYGLTCAALPVLRRRGGEAGFTLRGAGLVVPVAIGFALWLLSTRTFSQAWILLALMAVGALIHATQRSTRIATA
jgi:basic amino acid/polyamine antiporter, APA family